MLSPSKIIAINSAKSSYLCVLISSNLIAGDADYEEINLSSLLFDEMNRWQLFPVTIKDDELLESTEDFDLKLISLRFPFVTQPSGVILSPNVSTVYIKDDDGNNQRSLV